MKLIYTEPEINITKFACENVVTDSGIYMTGQMLAENGITAYEVSQLSDFERITDFN